MGHCSAVSTGQPPPLNCCPCPADVDFALFVLPDSDNDNIQIITDPSVISNYPTLNNEASCTSNCLFKRSKDDILYVADTSNLFRDFTNIVALWSQDSVDSATGAQSVSCKLLSDCTDQHLQISAGHLMRTAAESIARAERNLTSPCMGSFYMLLDCAKQLPHCSLTAVRTAKAQGTISLAAADSMGFYMQNLVTYQGRAANLRIDRLAEVATIDAAVQHVVRG